MAIVFSDERRENTLLPWRAHCVDWTLADRRGRRVAVEMGGSTSFLEIGLACDLETHAAIERVGKKAGGRIYA